MTAEVDDAPKLIPKVIHQTYKTGNIPNSLKPFMHSWRRLNEDWEIRFYDDEACLKFVQREFPEYLDAYRSLAKDVERSDFFRWGPDLPAQGFSRGLYREQAFLVRCR